MIDRALEERFSAEDVPESGSTAASTRPSNMQPSGLDLPEDDGAPERLGAAAAETMERTARELRIEPDRLRRLLKKRARWTWGNWRRQQTGRTGCRRCRAAGNGRSTGRFDSMDAVRPGALPRLVFDTEALIETIGSRRLFRERPDVRLMRLAHPVMRRAASTLHRRLWQQADGLNRFTVGSAPGLDEPVLVIPCVLTVVNDLRESLHAELVEMTFRLTNSDVGPTDAEVGDPVPLEDPALEPWRSRLEDRWPDIAPAVERHRESLRDEFEERARALLPGLLAEEQEAQQMLYDRRIRELERDAGERGRERLRQQIEQLEDQMNQLTFDPEHRADQEERLRQMRQQLEEAEYRRIEERRERQRERLVRERDPARRRRRFRAGTPSRVARCSRGRCPSRARSRRVVSNGLHAWWGDLRHGGMLIAPALVEEALSGHPRA